MSASGDGFPILQFVYNTLSLVDGNLEFAENNYEIYLHTMFSFPISKKIVLTCV